MTANMMAGEVGIRESAVEGVQRRIAGMVEEGALTPGGRLPPQRAFSEQLGVSRATLREALLRLETLGIVRTEPARGTFVALPSSAPEDGTGRAPAWRFSDTYPATDVFRTRLVIEGELAALAAGHVDAAGIARLSHLTDRMEESWARGNRIGNVEADLAFHALIVSAAPNAMLRDLYASVRAQIGETQRHPITVTEPARMRASVSEHRAIIGELRAGRPGDAREAMHAHIRNTASCAGLVL